MLGAHLSRRLSVQQRMLPDMTSSVAGEHPLAAVKPLRLEIPFDASLVEVVAGTGEAQRAAAAQIARALSARCGATVDVVDPGAYAGWDVAPRRHAILVGSLGDNAAIEFLYHRWLAFVDRAYPGAGGYVLTTLWEAWGKGVEQRPNALVVGAADAAGLQKAADRLCAVIQEAEGGIARLHEVVYGESLEAERERVAVWAVGGHPEHGWRYPYVGHGHLYHVPQLARATARSGDPAMEAGMRTLLLELATSPVLSATPNGIHLYGWQLQMAWPLLETSPVYSDQDRLAISRFLYDVLVSPEGYKNARVRHLLTTTLPRQNHETLCALGVAFGAAYFGRHYALPEIDAAWEVADGVLGFGAVCSKQIEDDNQHGWNQCIGDYASYALLTGRMGFFENGMALMAAERAAGNCSSNGFVATVGDGPVDQYPYWFLAQVAFTLREPGLRFVCENVAPEIERVDNVLPPRLPYDAGFPAKPPLGHVGTRVFPLDKHYYDIPAIEPGKYAVNAPNVPHARTFDVLTMRSGWAKGDQHLILDGTGGGSHSYEDANAILMLTQDDRFLLISPDYLYNTAPRDHNMVTVTRNGLGKQLPSFSRLDAAASLPTFGYTATTLRDYVGTDWTRSLLWKRGDFFVVVDHIVAQDRARYDATCRWFGLGEAEIQDGACVFHQSEWRGSRTDFVVHNVSGAHLRTRPAHYGAPSTWRSGYDPRRGPLLRTDRTTLVELDQSQGETLEAGEAIRLVNVLYARSGPRVGERLMARAGDGGWLLVEGSEGPHALHAGGPDGASVTASGAAGSAALAATCSLLVVWNGGVAAAGCTSLKVAGLSIQFTSPCGLEVGASGAVTLVAPVAQSAGGQQAPVTGLWRLDDGRSGEVRLEVGEAASLEVGGLKLPDARLVVGAPRSTLRGSKGTSSPRRTAAVGPSAVTPSPLWTARIGGCVNWLHAVRVGGSELLLAAGEDGTLSALGSDGSTAWQYRASGPVNAVHSGVLRAGEPARIVIGCEDEHVIALDVDTRAEVWRRRLEFGHQFWSWWAWYNASVMRVRVADVDGDGNGEVLVVSGNMHAHLLDAGGAERWRFRTDHGMFLTFTLCDLDGDGQLEIVGGNDFMSSASRCRVIGADGVQKATFENAGWTSQLKAVLIDDLDGDGELEVVCAASRGESVRVHSLKRASRWWGQYLGEVPIGLALLRGPAGADGGGSRVLLAATEGTSAVGFSPSGEPLWTVDATPGVARVVGMDGTAALVCADGRVVQVWSDGMATLMGTATGDVTAAEHATGQLVLGTADGVVAALAIPAHSVAAGC